jgi:hypothetical protein
MTGKRLSPAEHLAPAPAKVRARMLADAAALAPGAAAATGRFFRILGERGEPIAAPSRASFDLAATSEATLGTLLRALERYAPDVCLAGGREARSGWYARRVRTNAEPRQTGPAPLFASAPTSWPLEWARLYPSLMAARIRDTSRRRYVASICRCAEALADTDADPDWSRYTAYSLLEAWEEEGLRPATIAGYLGGLVALGKHGGVSKRDLDGVRDIRNLARSRAESMEKLKVARIEDLTERGGFAFIAATIGRLRAEAASLPASAAAAEAMRQTAAILAVVLMAPARTGDVARWVLGEDLVRWPCGTWYLAWTQGKTGGDQAPGELWPEIGEVLDELVLAGRPARFIHLQYQRLVGLHWLTHTVGAVPSRQPSFMVRMAIGNPLHDLRTLLADLMRRNDPATARRIIAAMLGHASEEAGESYRALCEGDAAAQDWYGMRRSLVEQPALILGRR